MVAFIGPVAACTNEHDMVLSRATPSTARSVESMECVERMDVHRASRMANLARNEMEDIQAIG